MKNLLAKKERVRLTTIDNPFNQFEDFTSWFLFDCEKGYNTCCYLAKIAKTSDSLSENENDEENERAIDEILAYDVRGIYRKVSPSSKIVPISLSA